MGKLSDFKEWIKKVFNFFLKHKEEMAEFTVMVINIYNKVAEEKKKQADRNQTL